MEGHVASKDIGVAGATLRCYVSPGAGPEVVLLHEAFSSSMQFREQLNGPLGRQLRLIAVDLPGHGASKPPADVHKYYTVTGMAQLVHACLAELNVRSAFVVCSGLGARVGLKLSENLAVDGLLMIGTAPLKQNTWQSQRELLARAPVIANMADTVSLSAEDVHELLHHYVSPDQLKQEEFVWLPHALKHTDARHRNVVRREMEANIINEMELLSSLPTRAKVGIVAGAHDHLFSFDYVSFLKLPILWRHCVQVVPGAYHFVAAVKPVAFDAIVRDLIKDVRGSIAPLRRKVDPAAVDVPAGGSGAFTHPGSRFEGQSAVEELEQQPAQNLKQATTPQAQNRYARGKVPGGTMPHPATRFEGATDSVPYAKEPVVNNPAMAANPYARGRVKGGVMPHPGARFEGGAQELEKEPVVQNESVKQNPYARGRTRGGVMPHPSARFEGQPEPPMSQPPQPSPAKQQQNPYARGRVPAGTMPHPGARFEGHYIDRPRNRAQQPPGGRTHSNIFG